MTNNDTILTEIKGSTATIWLNRPEKHNALNNEMISGFLLALRLLNSLPQVRIILIRGKGKTFCAGADLDWMQRSSLLSAEENYSECESLARCFFELFHSPKVTMCMVHGSSIGGGNGFVSASDISVSEDTAVLSFSEVRVGLVPATIAPYVIRKTGRAKAVELMLTGRKLTAAEAAHCGLISGIVPAGEADYHLNALIRDILKGAPDVQKIIKTSLPPLGEHRIDESVIVQTASILAETRISNEAREGISAFFGKRKTSWDSELT